MTNLLDAIKFCVDVRNIMVFDEHSQRGVCTKSLLYHMIQYAQQCEIFYVPEHTYIDCIPIDLTDIHSSFTVFDKSIERISESKSIEHLKHYKSLGGALPVKKTNIVIATISDGEFTDLNTILGCY